MIKQTPEEAVLLELHEIKRRNEEQRMNEKNRALALKHQKDLEKNSWQLQRRREDFSLLMYKLSRKYFNLRPGQFRSLSEDKLKILKNILAVKGKRTWRRSQFLTGLLSGSLTAFTFWLFGSVGSTIFLSILPISPVCWAHIVFILELFGISSCTMVGDFYLNLRKLEKEYGKDFLPMEEIQKLELIISNRAEEVRYTA